MVSVPLREGVAAGGDGYTGGRRVRSPHGRPVGDAPAKQAEITVFYGLISVDRIGVIP
jgi:hypothetical protein